ncbi:MAG: anaerobic glycerol-3-phosphate dehydrogenase subunit A [Propionibacteriaceae bacterium]|jgi:glycerol-3-phosphate dehydrogenase|nr:anaerobic glycerol-3-phosphate dehydrogenase subunit A [Propionibacteriaceae bacterium]
MRRLSADVVVIGGGATGSGVVRDCAMRGYKAVLVERADLAQGTSARFHGLLHSGGRYVVADPESGAECARENAILKRIQANAIETTGGLFVSFDGDDPEFPDKFVKGAEIAKLPFEEISAAQALKREPRLNPKIQRVMAVEDGTVDGWALCWGAVRSAIAYGAQVLTYTEVTSIDVVDGAASAVHCTDRKSGEEIVIDTGFVLNAGGPWAGKIAEMVGVHDVNVVPGRGVMVAMSHRVVNGVVNHLIKPADGDIIVPVHTVAIVGTTDTAVPDPDRLELPRDEVQKMLDMGEKMIPGFRESRALHAWSGARPLVKDTRVAAGDTRHMSRGMSIIDHESRDGLKGFLTIAGGKLTTYRLMAKNIVDVMCEQLGDSRPCTTDTEPVPEAKSGKNYFVSHRLHDREQEWQKDQIICECELMSRKMFEKLLEEKPDASFDDLRRQLRLGMGPCQGGFCSLRAAGIACDKGSWSADHATAALRLFLKNRWIGLWPILSGDQLKQTALDNWIFSGTLDIEHLPATEEVVL